MKIIALSALALVAMLAVASATDLPFTSCGTSSDIFTVKDIQLDGKLSGGQTIDIVATGTSSDSINGGSFKLTVKFFGIALLTKTGDICNSGYLHVACPVAAGPVKLTGSLSLPSSVPSGQYTIEISGTSSTNASLFCVSVTVSVSEDEELDLASMPAMDQATIDAVNAAGTTWTAGMNERFRGASLADVAGLCGTFTEPEKLMQLPASPTPELVAEAIPASFDARVKWPKCADWIGHIRDQANCGSCWAFGSTEAFNDRKCIATDGAFQTELSAQDTTSCCTLFTGCGFSQGCSGGDPGAAWNYFTTSGVVSGGDYDAIGKGTTCFPYQIPNCSHHEKGKYANCSTALAPTPACPSPHACSEKTYGTPWAQDIHKAKTAYSIQSVAQMQTELMTYGSITAAFTVYADFPTYRSGVYQHTHGAELGGHAIKILGWGEENGTPYWLVANSWNKYWGADGYFKILRGQDECGIESQVSAGHA